MFLYSKPTPTFTLMLPLLLAAGATSAAPGAGAAGAWDASLGIAVQSRPEYPGAARVAAGVQPAFVVNYRSRDFGSVAFGTEAGGLRWTPCQTEDASFGMLVSYDAGRRDDAHGRPSRPGSTTLEGMGRIPGSLLYGGYAAFDVGKLFSISTVVVRSGSRDGGTRAQIGVEMPLPAPARLELSVVSHLNLADARYVTSRFGVSPSQALRSGRQVYEPEGGLLSFGVGMEARYAISAQWRLAGSAGAERLLGDAAYSPLTLRRMQPYAELTLMRVF